MTYGVTPNGFVKKDFDTIRSEVEAYQRGNINNGLVLADDTSLGSHNVSHILQTAELWELAQAVYTSLHSDTANDWSLVQVCALTGTSPNKYSKTVVAGYVTMNPNKALPAGSIAHLTDRPNTLFLSLTDVPASPGGGVFQVDFEAKDSGTISVAPGQLSGISVAVSGWTAVTNTEAGVPGSQPEEDPELRAKRERELESAGSTNLDAIIARVSDVPTVAHSDGYENTLSYTVDGLPPHSVHIIVRGGAAQDVAQAIYESKAAGIRAFGSTLNTVVDSQGRSHLIGHSQATSVAFFASMVLVKDTDWTPETADEVKATLSNYINSLAPGQDGVYDKISGYVSLSEGVYQISTLFVGRSDPPLQTTDVVTETYEFLESDIANIDVSWTT